MGHGMDSAIAIAVVVESAFGLLHGLTDGVQIVAGRDDREEQNQHAGERAYEDEGSSRGTVRRSPALPQCVGRQQ